MCVIAISLTKHLFLGYLGCFQILAIRNRDIINIKMQISFLIKVFWTFGVKNELVNYEIILLGEVNQKK